MIQQVFNLMPRMIARCNNEQVWLSRFNRTLCYSCGCLIWGELGKRTCLWLYKECIGKGSLHWELACATFYTLSIFSCNWNSLCNIPNCLSGGNCIENFQQYFDWNLNLKIKIIEIPLVIGLANNNIVSYHRRYHESSEYWGVGCAHTSIKPNLKEILL